ncbi:hypothetical protein LNTAR_06039 [Lentisphaera araneosa HTCC2155]|uniref:Uncharacterized protein n=1 Tax=Lentisphaera araneosa HTCC2155 TaxID=313628 RepID=A6DPL6_9BACT|nr:DUF6607 family protein [Lentisphaera araneosa]EDM26512.1 hypothetical protein LNTAR_06039 [Lentisphaera araneosa HTCC2155]
MFRVAFVCLSLFLFASCSSSEKGESEAVKEKQDFVGPSQVFGWPFLEPSTMKSQGGMTTGSPVSLDHDESVWKSLQEEGISKFERDRRAILAMAGDYRVSFQFLETAGYTVKFHPARPYFSWGTEAIRVIKDDGKEISLQHTLCMWFKGENGELQGPMVMKHWRQDWKYEDTFSWDYLADNKWQKQTHSAEQIAGSWSQKVFQVDDSPRYFTAGKWVHNQGVSTWRSDVHRRPLPRREFAVRSDYNILQGIHDITITPNGWVHFQNNNKVNRVGDDYTQLSQETGINRYERISEPELTSADEYWEKTSAYWAEVRKVWEEKLSQRSQLKIKSKHEGKKLYMHHFSYAGAIKAGEYDSQAGKKHARETIESFLEDTDKNQKSSY